MPSPTIGQAALLPTTTASVIAALALRAARRPDGWASRSTCSAKLLLTLLLQHTKATQVKILQLKGRATGPRLGLKEGSILWLRAHLSGVSGVDEVESSAVNLVSLSAGSSKM